MKWVLERLSMVGYSRILPWADKELFRTYLTELLHRKGYKLLLIQIVSLCIFLTLSVFFGQRALLQNRFYLVRMLFIGVRAHAMICAFRSEDFRRQFQNISHSERQYSEWTSENLTT